MLNICRQHLRQNRQRKEANWVILDLHDIHDPGPDPYTVFEAQDLHQHVLDAIDDLPPQTQQTALLFYYQQMSLKEVAALLGVSVGTVKQQLHRAREKLKDPLRPLYHEYFAPPQRAKQMISLHIAAIISNPNSKDQVILTDESGKRNISLPIDPTSAQALIRTASGSPTIGHPTFTQRLIDTLDATLESVTLNQLPQDILCAELTLKQNNQIKKLDTTPGEAFALATSTGIPITADPEILNSPDQASDPLTLSLPAISVTLPSDSFKGKIVGKNGRNIITFEILTDVKLIINATPQTIHIVSSDPQKRAVAKRALTDLIASDRVNPDLIAKAVSSAQNTTESDQSPSTTDLQLFFTLPNTQPSRAIVTVPNEQVQKRFIGSKGRNALAFESATGVHAFISDAIPNKTVLWSLDTDKLEVARLALERIIKEDNINPDLINETVSACKAQHYLKT